MAEESTTPNTFKYYNKEYDLNALKQTMREGLNDYINTLSYYKYGNRGKEVRDAFDEMWEAMLTPGRMYFDDTKGVFWDRQNKISNKADAKDAAHDPYGLAAYYIESKLKGATPWEDPDEKARKEKEANKPTLASGFEKALYKKLYNTEEPTEHHKQSWFDYSNDKKWLLLINALKGIDITLFKDYTDRFADNNAYLDQINRLAPYITDSNHTLGFLDNEYLDFYNLIPYVDWHLFSGQTTSQKQAAAEAAAALTATQPTTSTTALTTTPSTSNTTYWINLMRQEFPTDDYGTGNWDIGSTLYPNYSFDLQKIYNYLNLRAGYPAQDSSSGEERPLTDENYATLNAYLYTALQNGISLSSLPEWLRKDENNHYWIEPRQSNGTRGSYVYEYDPTQNKLFRRYRPEVDYYITHWANARKSYNEAEAHRNLLIADILGLRHGGRMIPKAQPGADTNTWLNDQSLWLDEKAIMDWLVENYATNPNLYNLTSIYGVRDGQWGDAFNSAGSNTNVGTYKTATNANGTTARARENDSRYLALTEALFTDKDHKTLSKIGLLYALMVDAINPQDEALFFEYETDNNGKIKRDKDGKRIVVKDTSGNPKLREGKIIIKDNDLKSHTYDNVADMMYNLRTDNKLSVVHNSFGTDVSRYYIEKDDGTKMYIKNNNTITMPLDYGIEVTDYRKFDPNTGLYITDYKLIPKTKQAEEKVEKEVKKEEKEKVEPEGDKSKINPLGDTGGGDDLKKKKLFDIEPWAIGIIGLLPGLFTSIHANNRVAKILNEHLRPTVYNPYELLRPVVGDFATRMHYNNQAAGLRYFSLMGTTSDATLNYLQTMHGNKAANDLETQGYLADNKEIRRTADEAMKLQLQNTENRNRVANTNLQNINLTLEKRGEIESERIKGNADSLNDFFNKSRDFAWNMYTYKRGKKDEKEKAILAYGALSIVNKYDDMRALLRAAMKEALPGTTSLDWTNYPEFVEANRKISQAMLKELSQYAMKDPNDIDIEPFTELNITEIINNLKSAVKSSTTSSTTTSSTTTDGNKHGGRLVKKHFNI